MSSGRWKGKKEGGGFTSEGEKAGKWIRGEHGEVVAEVEVVKRE